MPFVTVESLDVPYIPISVKSAELHHRIYCTPVSKIDLLPTTSLTTSKMTLSRSFSSNLLKLVAVVLARFSH